MLVMKRYSPYVDELREKKELMKTLEILGGKLRRAGFEPHLPLSVGVFVQCEDYTNWTQWLVGCCYHFLLMLSPLPCLIINSRLTSGT